MNDVVLVAGDAEEACELADHQPDCRTFTDALGVNVFVLTHLAAGIGDRKRDTAWVAGAGVDDNQCIAEAAAMGRFVSGFLRKKRECS
jgi:hypothetical protein